MVEITQYKDLLLEKLSFANLAIIKSNGKPHVSPVWFDMSNEDLGNNIINVNTATGRVKTISLVEGAPVAISIMDPENAYRYLGIEGEVIKTITGEIAEKHIDSLAKKYLDADTYPYRSDTESRIKVVIKINKVHGN